MAKGKAEPARRGAWLVAGIGGAVLAVGFGALLLLDDLGAVDQDVLAQAFRTSLIGQAAAGFIVGLLLAFLFGRGGLFGWILAIVAGGLVSVVAGAVGTGLSDLIVSRDTSSLVIDRLSDLSAGAFVVPMSIAEAPVLGFLWLTLVGGIHTAVGWARQG